MIPCYRSKQTKNLIKYCPRCATHFAAKKVIDFLNAVHIILLLFIIPHYAQEFLHLVPCFLCLNIFLSLQFSSVSTQQKTFESLELSQFVTSFSTSPWRNLYFGSEWDKFNFSYDKATNVF